MSVQLLPIGYVDGVPVTEVAGVVVEVGLLLVFVSLPISVAIAVLRHYLYDVQGLQDVIGLTRC